MKSLAGDREHQEAMEVNAEDARARGACRIALTFSDGERVVGMTVRYPPIKPFFYVVPADPRSNNIRILVNRSAVTTMTQPSDTGAA